MFYTFFVKYPGPLIRDPGAELRKITDLRDRVFYTSTGRKRVRGPGVEREVTGAEQVDLNTTDSRNILLRESPVFNSGISVEVGGNIPGSETCKGPGEGEFLRGAGLTEKYKSIRGVR